MSIESIISAQAVTYKAGQQVLWRPHRGISGAERKANREGRELDSVVALARVVKDGPGTRVRVRIERLGELGAGNRALKVGLVVAVDRKDICAWSEPDSVAEPDVVETDDDLEIIEPEDNQ